jgi:hypothetical protein
MRIIYLLILFLLSVTLYAVCEFKGVRSYYHGLPCLICAFLLARYKLKLAKYL